MPAHSSSRRANSSVTGLPPGQEFLHRLARLVCRHREREPVARVVHRLMPGKVTPEVELLLRVAHGLRKLGGEALGDAVDLGVELAPRDGRVDETPVGGPRGRYLLTEEK